ncbi:MAG TPA: hypothetical protein DER40_12850 [Geobacter sp.]|nr:MAG: hypothetical protein A2X85_12820 [Geobacteraceae bacterium GWF2_54_21]HCE68357.1 hypothetical protein [Geobacter sp.]
MKIRKNTKGSQLKHVLGIAWYRREQWNRLLEVSADRDELEDNYDDWLRTAEGTLEKLKRNGAGIVKVDIDVNKLVAWCVVANRSVDGRARAEYVSKLLSEA